MNLKFNYTITEKEYTNFNYYTNKKQNIICFVILLVLLFVGQSYSRQAIIYAISCLVFYYIFIKIGTNVGSRRIYKTSKELQSETEIIVTDDEISERTILTTTVLKLKNMYKFGQDKISYYIYIDKIKAFIIPKRIMNDREKQEFEDSIKKYIKNK